ncbi:MAG: 3-hydroxyacyl-ACP dehydratase FabZ family protein [Phycisphaerales bacterium]
MPTEFLLDLETLDLGAVAIDAETVGQMNPQCGDMRQLDHIAVLDRENRYAVGIKKVREDEFWVPLHIPGRPLMPGVLMIEAAAQVSSIYHRLISGEDRFLGFTRCDETSFRGQVIPGDTLVILMQDVKYSPRRFVTRCQGLVDGKLVFQAGITGMVM